MKITEQRNDLISVNKIPSNDQAIPVDEVVLVCEW